MVLAIAVLYGLSERITNRRYDVPSSAFRADDDPALVKEGEGLAHIRGCTDCHGGSLEGGVFMDEPWLARIVAPDVSRAAATHTDAELERVIRHGCAGTAGVSG